MKPTPKQAKKRNKPGVKPGAAPAKPGPKPKLVYDDAMLDQIRALGQIQCTVEEIAAVIRRHDGGVGVSLRTMQNIFAAHPEAKDLNDVAAS